jgi:hypothetical protein
MMGKLPKSKAWKQSDPDRPGLLSHPRYLSRDSLSKSVGFQQSFHYSSKLELRKSVGPQRIPAELPHLSYEEGSRQAERPSGP